MRMGYMVIETLADLFMSWNHGSLQAARTFKVVQSSPVSATLEPPGGGGSAVT